MSAATPARRVAYETLRRVFEDGAWADRTLRSAADRHGLEGRERAQAQALAYGAVQRRGTSDAVTERLAERRADRIDDPLIAALRLGLFELLFSGGADHAAVDQAVSLAKGRGAQRRGSGLVNAVLRRASRERGEILGSLDDSTPEGAAIAHSAPPWLVQLWWDELGADSARAMLAAINEPPERALRANVLRADREGAAAMLAERGVETTPADPRRPPAPRDSLVVSGGELGSVGDLIAEGVVTPQSRASAMVVEVLDPRPGERVLDLCAGPGIKSGQIAAALGAGGDGLFAVERDPGRSRELEEMLGRIGADRAMVENADAAERRTGPASFDAILVDPPCSGLGTLASRPDARWRRKPEDIEATASLAERILEAASASLAPGGRIVYSTCTISRRENEEVVASSGLRPDDLGADAPPCPPAADSRFLQTRNDRDGTDGFFVARLRP